MDVKMMTIIAVSAVMFLSNVNAYEIKDNPDRKMSVGFKFDQYDMGGDYEYKSIKLANAGTLSQNNFKADIILPLCSFLSFSVGGGYSTTSLGLALINKDERWQMKGYNLSAGFRVFIP